MRGPSGTRRLATRLLSILRGGDRSPVYRTMVVIKPPAADHPIDGRLGRRSDTQSPPSPGITLAALARQELDGLQAEVLVVDNGSADGTVERVAELARAFPYRLRVLEEPNTGVSAARNHAVAEARGRLILSINDDTEPATPLLVAEHVRAHAEAEKPVAVLGRITYRQSELEANPFMAWLNDEAQFGVRTSRVGQREPLPNHFYTAHLSFNRECFQRMGGMDERLPFGFEDAELGARMLDSGVRLHYRPDLALYHHHPITPREWRNRAEQGGAAGALVNRLHPRRRPLAQPALSSYSGALAVAERVLARVPTDWRSLPSPLRRQVYVILNRGAYARGYRRGWRQSP
jgi:GT2 family glycosyltransferase